jgi:tyrosinase
MKASFFAATMAVAVGVQALPQITPATPLAPAIPLEKFNTPKFVKPLSLDDILAGNFPKPMEIADNISKKPLDVVAGLLPSLSKPSDKEKRATCSNPRVRQEWDSYSNSDRQAFVNAVRCLMSKPASGQFSQAKSRYEDLVALHQTLTPNVHGSSKFLIWHRYYLWTFEDLLRSECGFDRALPWWDETRYSGRFAQSSIFSSQWLGSINTGGDCVRDGVSTFYSHLSVHD